MIKKNNVFIQTSWKNTFDYINEKIANIKYNNIIINTGNYTDLESIVGLQKFADNFNNVIINPNYNFNVDIQNYNLEVEPIKASSKVFIFLGINTHV